MGFSLFLVDMVGVVGIEPAASMSRTWRATSALHPVTAALRSANGV